MKEVNIHYFSATGNTKRAVDLVVSSLQKNGYQVKLHLIGKEAPNLSANASYNLIAFPVLSFSAPVMVKKYVRHLPPGSGTKAAVFAVYGGNPVQALPEMERLLGRKGFDVFLTGGALYPSNWTQMTNPPSAVEAREISTGGDEMALAFAEDFRQDQRKLQKTGRLSGILAGLTAALFATIGRRFLGKAYIADRSCNSCKICVEACPVTAIKMAGISKKKPYWNFQCEDCGRCINVCPKKAIQVSLTRLILHVALNTGVIIAAVVLANLAAAHLTSVYRIPGWVAVFLASAALGLLLQITMIDRFLFLLARFPILHKLLAWSFTKRYNRYLSPGFKPAAKRGEGA